MRTPTSDLSAFTTKAKDDLDKLAAGIATGQREGQSQAVVQTLYKRFQGVQAGAAARSDLLSSSLEDTADAMTLVQAQLVSLLSTAEA